MCIVRKAPQLAEADLSPRESRLTSTPTWRTIVADKGSARHMRYCPFRPMGLTVLPFKRHLTWEGFFPPSKCESPLTHNRCGTIGALHIIRTTTSSFIKNENGGYGAINCINSSRFQPGAFKNLKENI